MTRPTRSDRPLSILFVHEIIPQPDHNGCDVRIMQVLRELVKQGHRVTYLARCGTYFKGPKERWPEYLQALEDLGIKVAGNDGGKVRFLGKLASTEGTLEQLLAGAKFDLAILMMWFWATQTAPEQYMPEIRKHSPTTRILVVTDDIHGLREQREAEVRDCWITAERAEEYLVREAQVYRDADLVFTVTELDRSRLLALVPEAQTDVLPMIAESAPAGPDFEHRSDFFFVGNFNYSQNVDGATWLFSKVWPLVRRELPDVKFQLAGSQIPDGFAAGIDGVAVRGQVPDLEPLFASSKVFVSPILFGTGIKTKNVIAAAHGIPLVTTSVGAEGMNLTHGVNAMIADNPDAFADAMISAYRNRDLWRQLAKTGRSHVRDEFGSKRLEQSVSRMARRALAITPKNCEPHLAPEELTSQLEEIANYVPAYNKGALLMVAYLRATESLLSKGSAQEALMLLRALLGILKWEFDDIAVRQYVLRTFAEAYRSIGRSERVADCERQLAKTCFATDKSLPRRTSTTGSNEPELSIILPASNGTGKLQALFAQLAMQSLHPDRWEVVLVDDGSSDGTKHFCKNLPAFCNLVYVRQEQAGVGAARRIGADRARGQVLLFMEEDTTPRRRFLEGHLRAQYELDDTNAVVCGNRDLPPDIAAGPILRLCSQVPWHFAALMATGLAPGIQPLSACNLSIRKELLIEAGSFDSTFAFADDVELGIRLRRMGVQVQYDERARATQNVSRVSVDDVVKKAELYAQAQVKLFRKYPQIAPHGAGPFGHLSEDDLLGLRKIVDASRQVISEWCAALQQLDRAHQQVGAEGGQNIRQEVLSATGQSLSAIFQFHFFNTFLNLWTPDAFVPSLPPPDIAESRWSRS